MCQILSMHPQNNLARQVFLSSCLKGGNGELNDSPEASKGQRSDCIPGELSPSSCN